MEYFESQIKNRSVEVVNINNNDIYNIIQFKETWFSEGDILEDINDLDHDIELLHKLDNRTFTYVGTAKIGEKYRIISK